MIRTFIDKLLRKDAPGRSLGKRVEHPASEHSIDPRLLDERAVNVVKTLQDAGHTAYVVGGAVRDLLVGRRPKDFDVATDATPEQVKALFRRAFIIGRRFRIVHVVFGRGRDHEVIEVSTFRANLDNAAAEHVQGNEKTAKAQIASKTHVVDATGRVLRDNVWGPQIEDAARRDFTVNAMYYDPRTQVVVDYHGGLKDVRSQTLRMIGDAPTRYREDPVRILRVVRFAAKLGFKLDAKTRAPLKEMAPLLAGVPASRLFDEMIKLLQTGHALASLAQLKALGLDRGIFPVLDAALHPAAASPARQAFIDRALADTDRRVAEDKAVAPSYMLACLLWHDVQSAWAEQRAAGEHPTPALQTAIDRVFDARIGDISGRGKLAADMREIWMMQPRFDVRAARSAASLVERPRWRAGFDFLRLRSESGEVAPELVDWWEDYALGNEAEREALLQAARLQTPRPPARVRGPAAAAKPAGGADAAGQPAPRRRGPAAGAAPRAAGEADGGTDDSAHDAAHRPDGGAAAGEPGATDAPAKRRRRRRRKPSGAGAAAAAPDAADAPDRAADTP